MRTTGIALNGAGAFGTVRLRGDMSKPEVWQRGPLPGVDPLLMPVAHAFVQVQEDLRSLAATTAADAVWQRPGGAASIAFHVRHIGGATDRLLTYARGAALSDAQRAALEAEGDESPPRPKRFGVWMRRLHRCAPRPPRNCSRRERSGAQHYQPRCLDCSSTRPNTRPGMPGRRSRPRASSRAHSRTPSPGFPVEPRSGIDGIQAVLYLLDADSPLRQTEDLTNGLPRSAVSV